jgi:hypothetical protein
MLQGSGEAAHLPLAYLSPTLTYHSHRDDSLKAERRVSVRTLERRVIVPYSGDTGMWR